MVESPCLNVRQYLPPTRTSISKDSRFRPKDSGTHHRRNSSALVHASNRIRAGALKARVTTSSRSDWRFTVVGLFAGGDSLLPASMARFLLFHFLDDVVQLVKALGP